MSNYNICDLDTFKEKLGNAVKKKRLEQNLSLDELSEKSESNKSYIWSIENGLANPTVYKLHMLANALGTDVSSLLV